MHQPGAIFVTDVTAQLCFSSVRPVMDLDTDPIDVAAHVQSLAHASGALGRSEMRAIQRCVDIGKEVLGSSATELIQKVNGSPMLSSKSADGTPISVM